MVADEAATEAERIGGRSAHWLCGPAQCSQDRDLLVGLLAASGLARPPASGRRRPGDDRRSRSSPTCLLVDWKKYSPPIRSAILDMLAQPNEPGPRRCSRRSRTAASPPAEIDPARRQQLLTRRTCQLKSRAEAVFAHQSKPRQAVVDAYRAALEIKGDQAAGAAVFKKLCASCHRLGNEGVEVGPDLAALNDKSPEALLIAILDPNRAFEARYANFSIATVDGRVLSGLIASESATAVTLRRQDGKEDVLLRSQIDEMTASGQSLMPEGLEKDLKPRDLADLIAFLVTAGPPRKPE